MCCVLSAESEKGKAQVLYASDNRHLPRSQFTLTNWSR